jgi:flavorubredoxin
MRALIVYASWFGHNRAVAQRVARSFEERHITTVCAPISQIAASDVIGCDILVLGSYTHTRHASKGIRELIENIPLHRLQRMAIGLFGVRSPDGDADGIDELTRTLEEAGISPAVAPLRINLRMPDYIPQRWLEPEIEERIAEFADELLEAAAAEVMV